MKVNSKRPKTYVDMATDMNIISIVSDEYLPKSELHSPDTRVFNTSRLEEMADISHNSLAYIFSGKLFVNLSTIYRS